MEASNLPSGNGGVAANLDYDIQIMSNFCSWIVFSLFKCKNPNSSPHFQSLLQSVLSATRLPKSTILLGIHYVSMKIDNDSQPCHVESQIFETLIIGLLLANKFNDDNTFKNKSWAEATGLNLDKINILERDWLRNCLWKLHDDIQYKLVESCWTTWCLRFNGNNNDYQAVPISSEPTSPFNSIGYSNGVGYTYPMVVSNTQQQVTHVPVQQYYTNNAYYMPLAQMQQHQQHQQQQQQFINGVSIPSITQMKPPLNYYGYAAVY